MNLRAARGTRRASSRRSRPGRRTGRTRGTPARLGLGLPNRTIVRVYRSMSERTRGADPPGRPALRREGLPRHVDRRPRRGAGRPEGLALRAHRVEAGPPLRDDARGRARLPRGARRDPGRAPAGREDPARAARAPARRRRPARRRDGLRPGVALPRGRAARRDPRRAPPLRGADPRALPRRARARRAAHATSTTRPRRCSRSRPRTGPTPGSSPAATPTSSPTASIALLLDGMRGYATPEP